MSVTPRVLEFAVITNLTEHFVAPRDFILIVDDLTIGECNNIVLNFGWQPIPVAL